MQFTTYQEIFDLIEALGGVDSFTTDEQAKILALVNRRLYQAYRSSEFWPRYIVSAQARPATEGLVPWEYDHVAGIRGITAATRSGTTVTLTLASDTDVVAGMTVTVAGLTGSEDPNGSYKVVTVEDNSITYDLEAGTGTETYGGSGTMSPVAIPAIDSFIRIWAFSPFSNNRYYDFDYYVEVDGARVVDSKALDGYWVAFKKRWDGPYTTAATTIPAEFREYAAHAAYADFLRMDSQVDKAMAEEAVAQQYLVLELDKVEHGRNVNTTGKRITTYVSRSNR